MRDDTDEQTGDQLSVPYATYVRGARVGARAQLDDIRIHSLHAELNDFGAPERQLRPRLSLNVQVTPPTDGGSFIVAVDYELDLERVNDESENEVVDDEGPQKAATITIGVAGLYTCEGLPEDLEDDELESFGASAGALALHPYAREVISTTVQRFGLRQFLIPPLRVVSDEPLTQ